jgi:hypothetical protein
METSIFIAKIIAIIYISLGIGLLVNKKYYQVAFEKILTNPSYLFLGGFFAIIMGFLIIENHNYWVNNWTILITIIGWAALIKGIFLIAFPKSFSVFKPMFTSKIFFSILGPLVLILGFIFLYFGFFS